MKRWVAALFVIVLLAFPASAWAATLSLAPSSGTFNAGCNFSLNIELDTQSTQTDGTDVILFYDSSRFTAQSITNGTIYPDYPGNNIDAAGGKIIISGLASVTTPFNGRGTFATINMSVNATAPAGATQVKFDFDPNDKAKTTDSNVVERGTVVDVLNSVVNGSYTIGTGSCVGGGATPTPYPGYRTPGGGGVYPPASPSAVPYPTKDPYLPPAGSEQLTYTLAIVGVTLTVLGILGLALL